MKTVEQVIEGVFRLKPGSLRETDGMHTVARWDSIGHLEILMALDDEFQGKLEQIHELSGATSVKAIKDILRSRGLLPKERTARPR